MTKASRYPNFDLLRLLLAVEVVYYHAGWRADPTFQWRGWIMAVPAFLAISGFLVLKSYEETRSFPRFAKKRALRILPVLTLALLISASLFGWGSFKTSFLTWASGGLWAIGQDGNPPLWSLLWEEIAYGTLAVLWLAGAYRRPAAIWVLFICSLALIPFGTPYAEGQMRMVILLPCAFLVGNLMYIYRDVFTTKASFIPWVMLYLVIEFRVLPNSSLGNGSLLLLLQTFTVVWIGIAGTVLIPFRFPDISYSLYALHWPVLLLIGEYVQPAGHLEMLIWAATILVPLCLAVWFLVERPAHRLKPANRSRGNAVTA